jgi:hypothetical protein
MRKFSRTALAVCTAALIALVVSACGSSSNNSSSGGSSASAPSSVPTTGPGLTAPTPGVGSKISGGTVYFTEGSDAPPNYIFPMYTFAVCSTTNADQLMNMLYYPL